jgi:uncharacterized protein (DUF608 family)
MVIYTSDQGIGSGVPLGGIGAGKIEIDNKGKMVNLTVANNWTFPIKEMLGFHIFIKPDDSEPFFLQRELRFLNLNKLATNLTYEGKYPFVRISGGKVNAVMEAFSPIIPSDVLDSSLPAIGISIKVKGSSSGTVAVSISNICGINKIGRYNERVKGGIRTKNSRSNEYDPYNGEMSLISLSPGKIITQYNFHVNRGLEKTLNLHRLIENEAPWDALLNDKDYPSDDGESQGSYYLPAGLISNRYDKGEELKFVLSWYFNKPWVYYPYRHYYANYFSSSLEVANYFLDNFDILRKKTFEWQENLIDPSLPEWLKDAVINSTYILSSSTWLDEKGRFSIYEAPEIGPMLGTIGGVVYETGSLPIILMFPELEKSFLKMISLSIREDGYVPHDLGTYSLDSPSDGTTAPPKWKDTNTTFILLVYRYYIRTKDKDFLMEMYPTVLKAMEWIIKQDKDNDGLPELDGSCDTGYDCVPMEGISSYTSSLYIASLISMIEISQILGDSKNSERMRLLLQKAKDSFNRLFDGKKFIAWTGKPQHNNASFAAQIFGEWWSLILGIEDITDKDKIISSLDTIYRVNGNSSKYCTPNMAREDGGPVDIDSQLTSSWPRLVFSLSALAYSLGKKEWLSLAKKEWDNLVNQGLTWNHPSIIHGEDGKPDKPFLDHYAGSTALWSFTYKYTLEHLSDKK